MNDLRTLLVATALSVSLGACAPAEPASTVAQWGGPSGGEPASADVPDCVHAWGEARARYPGYDHVVFVENNCRGRAHCRISTNVDPEPIFVLVDAGEQLEVVVRQGSPSREFVPRAQCAVEGPDAFAQALRPW